MNDSSGSQAVKKPALSASPQSIAKCDIRSVVAGSGTGTQQQTRRYRGTVSAEEAANILSISRRTLHRWASDGKMPARVQNGCRTQWQLMDIRAMADRKMELNIPGKVL